MHIKRTPIFLLLIFFSSSLPAQESGSGSLQINVNLPEPFYVVIDDNLIEAQKVDSGSVFKVETGFHSFVIVSKFAEDHFFHAIIEEDKLTLYDHRFTNYRINYNSTFNQLENRQNLFIRTDPNSEIYLDGEYVGKHTQSLLLNSGDYTIKTVHPSEGSLQQRITIDYGDDEYVSRYNIPQHENSSIASILPGAGYILNGQDHKAIATYITMGLLAGSYFTIEKKITRQRRIWDVEKLESLQTASLIGIGVVYVISIIDGNRKPKNGYPERSFIFKSEDMSLANTSVPTVGFKVNF